MNRHTSKRTAVGLLVVTTVAIAALTTGVLRPVKDQRLLFVQAEQAARSCVKDAGHEYPAGGVPLGELQSGSPRRAAYDACWTRVATAVEYSSLKIPTPAALLRKSRTDGYRRWRCVENAGFRRTTPIPLNGPNGFPLMPASRHFSVAGSQTQLRAFYAMVARCAGDMRIDDFRGPDGKFAHVAADGASCERHGHSGDRHSHGCDSVDAYPKEF